MDTKTMKDIKIQGGTRYSVYDYVCDHYGKRIYGMLGG